MGYSDSDFPNIINGSSQNPVVEDGLMHLDPNNSLVNINSLVVNDIAVDHLLAVDASMNALDIESITTETITINTSIITNSLTVEGSADISNLSISGDAILSDRNETYSQATIDLSNITISDSTQINNTIATIGDVGNSI